MKLYQSTGTVTLCHRGYVVYKLPMGVRKVNYLYDSFTVNCLWFIGIKKPITRNVEKDNKNNLTRSLRQLTRYAGSIRFIYVRFT